VVENDLVLHHAGQDVSDEDLKHGFVHCCGEAILVRKDFIEEESRRLNGHQQDVLYPDQVVQLKLEPSALNCQVLYELSDYIACLPDGHWSILRRELDRCHHKTEVFQSVEAENLLANGLLRLCDLSFVDP